MPWGIVYLRGTNGDVPAEDFLDRCPSEVEAKLNAVLDAVRRAPPPQFSGGGNWEAMHGSMKGYYEIRVTGQPNRTHYRLFCILDNGSAAQLAERGFEKPQIAVINGMAKANATLFSDREYEKNVRKLGVRYKATLPRPIAEDEA